jgi:hypothetical protein
MTLAEIRLLGLPEYRRAWFSHLERRARLSLPVGVRRALSPGKQYHCPVCSSDVAGFRNFGSIPNCWCPVCGAMGRHRLMWHFLKTRTNLFDGQPKRMLHIAPEDAFERQFTGVPNLDYLTADLDSRRAMVQMDITDIQYPAGHFDIIHCSHVLEHVPDDRRAMRELRRVLTPTGWAVFMVPITVDRTVEDSTLTDPAERERRFGQHDHVRRYGPDFTDRLRSAGLAVEALTSENIIDRGDLERFGVNSDATVFYSTRS